MALSDRSEVSAYFYNVEIVTESVGQRLFSLGQLKSPEGWQPRMPPSVNFRGRPFRTAARFGRFIE